MTRLAMRSLLAVLRAAEQIVDEMHNAERTNPATLAYLIVLRRQIVESRKSASNLLDKMIDEGLD